MSIAPQRQKEGTVTGAAERVRVDASEYLELLVSRRPLVRTEDVPPGHTGLLDVREGTCYVIAEQDLRQV
jgi:hypothetical protein